MVSLNLLMRNISASILLEPCHVFRPLGYYLMVICIVGTVLNGFVLYIFIRHKKLRQSSTNILIGGLVFADFIAACFGIPLPAIALLGCRWFFGQIGCIISAIVAYFTGCSNMYMLCLISIDRYFVIQHSSSTMMITTKQAYLIILGIYTLALMWALMPMIGWSRYDFEGTGVSCSIKWEEHSFNVISYNMTIFTFVYLIPVIILILVNLKVLEKIHRHRPQTNLNLNRNRTENQLLMEHRVCHTVMFIIGGFLLAWTPYAITVFIRIFIYGDLFPPVVITIPAMIVKTSVIWNPLIYIVRNGNFRDYLSFQQIVQRNQQRRMLGGTQYQIQPQATINLSIQLQAGHPED